MQGGKSSSAVGAAKEAVANVGASAWAGKEKTKAVVQEKVDKVKAHDPAAKASAEARKQERIGEVEAVKQDVMHRNAAAKEHATAASYHPTAATEVRDVELQDAPPVAAAAVPRAGSSDDSSLHAATGHGVGKGDGYLPARGTPGGHSA
ncbi:unnamed protein product [Alopecurus aequalis]